MSDDDAIAVFGDWSAWYIPYDRPPLTEDELDDIEWATHHYCIDDD